MRTRLFCFCVAGATIEVKPKAKKKKKKFVQLYERTSIFGFEAVSPSADHTFDEKKYGVGFRIKVLKRDEDNEDRFERGRIRYIGTYDVDDYDEEAENTWIGIQFDNAVGDSNGKGKSRLYYRW